MTRKYLCLLLLAAAPLAASHGCAEPNPDTRAPADPGALSTRAPATDRDPDEDETDEQAWKSIRAALGREGAFRNNVLSFVFARDDLEVTIQGNDTPAAAGIASDFRFYRCPCGLLNVIGQFVVADYEANDVIDALREGHLEVASVGPMLLHERPRLLLIRFQGENKHGGALARTLRTALSWTGKERMAPQKLDH